MKDKTIKRIFRALDRNALVTCLIDREQRMVIRNGPDSFNILTMKGQEVPWLKAFNHGSINTLRYNGMKWKEYKKERKKEVEDKLRKSNRQTTWKEWIAFTPVGIKKSIRSPVSVAHLFIIG